MDKTEPRTVSAVIDELKREETKRKEMEKKTNFLGKLSPTKSNDSEKENMVTFCNCAKTLCPLFFSGHNPALLLGLRRFIFNRYSDKVLSTYRCF